MWSPKKANAEWQICYNLGTESAAGCAGRIVITDRSHNFKYSGNLRCRSSALATYDMNNDFKFPGNEVFAYFAFPLCSLGYIAALDCPCEPNSRNGVDHVDHTPLPNASRSSEQFGIPDLTIRKID